ncbi:anti-sigma factor family protein [Frateuria sp. GZRe14]|jgi:anti-sigma factor RsiW|uniref:anti-sigma factor family protein n=1 Tax=Frateuria sp. GZRe14 TaxID=3351534 RepID=UPI003EDBC773
MTFPNRCARAWEAMPWVLQGTATPQDNEWLSEHLAHCEACRTEFEQQSRLRLALTLPADVGLDPNAGLDRLMARLDQPEPAEASRPARASPWLSRALVAAVLVQAIGIGILGAKLWSENPAPVYRTLSQESAPVMQGSIHVVPDAGMKLADWDALLRGLDLKVVDGPNDVGAYTVVAARGSAQDTLKRLRAARGIRLAEPADARP